MAKVLPIDKQLDELCKAYRLGTRPELQRRLGHKYGSTISGWIDRNMIPLNVMLEAAQATGTSLDQMYFGEELNPQAAAHATFVQLLERLAAVHTAFAGVPLWAKYLGDLRAAVDKFQRDLQKGQAQSDNQAQTS